jgi:hypothetical protein
LNEHEVVSIETCMEMHLSGERDRSFFKHRFRSRKSFRPFTKEVALTLRKVTDVFLAFLFFVSVPKITGRAASATPADAFLADAFPVETSLDGFRETDPGVRPGAEPSRDSLLPGRGVDPPRRSHE